MFFPCPVTEKKEDHHMNTATQTTVPRAPLSAWNDRAPYTAMLEGYRAASDKITLRLAELRAELNRMQKHKSGTLRGAREQSLLEKRIMLLYDERAEIAAVMRVLEGYAAAEVQA